MQKPFNSNNTTFILILFFFLIYLLLPNQNSSIDAFNYAANVKWNHDIFFPHHLLFNFLHYYLIKFISFWGYQVEILAFMKFLNTIFATLSLIVFSRILLKYQTDKRNVFPIVLIAGSCFGFMRYATENEAYIIPIFWSLLSTYYFLKYTKSNSKFDILYSGIFASISCLFHQIHIMWYIGLFLGTLFYKKEHKNSFFLTAPAILLPIAYYIAFKQVHFDFIKAENLWQFVFYDYYYGTAHVQFGIDNLILGIISFVRSFIQVHGIMPILIKKNYLYGFAFAPLLFFSCQIIKYVWITKFEKLKSSDFVKTISIIFILQFVFSIFSEGNMEFMVMLPMLLLLIINGLFNIKNILYLYLGSSILIWNLAFGLVPNHFYDFQNQEKIIQIIENKKDAIFVLSDDVLVQNMIYYKTGTRWNSNIYKSPASLKQLNKSNDQLKLKMDSCLSNNMEIFTDCIAEPIVMSRKQYFVNNENDLFLKDYKNVKIDSVKTIIGTKYINLIKKSSTTQ